MKLIFVFMYYTPSTQGGYSHILAIQVYAAGKGKVFNPFSLGWGLVYDVITENYSRIGSRLTGLLIKD